MEETVIDQLENEMTKPVEEEAVAAVAEDAPVLEDVVDTPESSDETEDVAAIEDAVEVEAIDPVDGASPDPSLAASSDPNLVASPFMATSPAEPEMVAPAPEPVIEAEVIEAVV